MHPLIDKLNVNISVVVSIAITIIILGILFVFESITQKDIMSKNIDNAINKGIDPITVRCAYAPSTDSVCLAYAITHKPIEAPEAPKKK